jgi:4-amino-4-deoxy-L-arabinose transferase-like glycosyltransferase
MTTLAELQPPRPAVADGPGRPGRAGWERPTLVAILLATAVLYLWGLGASGWANSFYSAAVQAGSVSWKAFLFGSFDAANAITVDKPPAALWVMALSVKLFGLSSWSILVPQALMGVGTVAAVWYGVRRWFSAGAALLAAIAMALTPVAVLMFRFNNPDALLTLLMTLAAITTLRGIEDGRRRWVVATGVLVGLGFLTKQLQVMLLVPPLAIAWVVAAKGTLRRRLVDLLVAGAAIVVSAGWWVALVELWPAGSRPWIGGSQTNSILELTFGYNGLGRITGNEVGSVTGGGAAQTGRWGQTGITRMFDGAIGGQIAWLIPAALVAIVAGLWVTRPAARTDRQRASLLVWGGWLVVTALTFSYMAGIFHEYYTVALAPPIAALVGIGAYFLWRHRSTWAARIAVAVVVLASALWAVALLGRAGTWNAWLRPPVLVGGVAAAVGLLVAFHRRARLALVAGSAAAMVLLAGPAAWSLQTVATPHSGSLVTAGPTVDSGGAGGRPGGFTAGGLPPGGTVAGQDGATRPARPGRDGAQNQGPGAGTFTGPGGGPGGLLNGSEPSAALTALLLENADEYTWVAAAAGANNASGYQLATERPVLAVGGFNGSDPFPTLADFQRMVGDGEIHWFISGGGIGAPNGGSRDSSEIAAWVAATFQGTQVDGVTLYDLTAAT